jgi:hypothetical protein
MRVRLDLFYRDASNYKESGSYTFAGPLRAGDVFRLQDAIDGEMGMVPSAVGLEHVSIGEGRTEDDHAWHEVRCVAIEDGDPEDPRTFEAFVDACAKADWSVAEGRWMVETPFRDPEQDDDMEGFA